jgi:hypothetical protein
MPTGANISVGGCRWGSLSGCRRAFSPANPRGPGRPLGRSPHFDPHAPGHLSLEVARGEIRKQEAAARV